MGKLFLLSKCLKCKHNIDLKINGKHKKKEVYRYTSRCVYICVYLVREKGGETEEREEGVW